MAGTAVRRFAVFATVAGLGVAATGAVPEAHASPTRISFTVEAGALSISAPTVMADLGAVPSERGVVTGSLGTVEVIDKRGTSANSQWVASVAATDFSSSSQDTLTADAISYRVGPITHRGIGTFTAFDPSELTTMTPAVTGTALNGPNSASWSPTVTVSLPSTLPAGTYTASITHSVS